MLLAAWRLWLVVKMWVAGASCPSWIGYMVEKELNAVPSLGNCSDALHLHCLIKC